MSGRGDCIWERDDGEELPGNETTKYVNHREFGKGSLLARHTELSVAELLR